MASKLGKKREASFKRVDRKTLYKVAEAFKLVKGCKTSKFDESVDVSFNLGVDPRHADQMVRGAVLMPNGTGKTIRVAVFAKGAKADEARAWVPRICTRRSTAASWTSTRSSRRPT